MIASFSPVSTALSHGTVLAVREALCLVCSGISLGHALNKPVLREGVNE